MPEKKNTSYAHTPENSAKSKPPFVPPPTALEKSLFPGVEEMNTGFNKSSVMLYYDDLENISNLTQRKLFYYGSDILVDTDMQYNIVKSIISYNYADREAGIAKEKRKPIILYILSPGGSVSEGFSIIDAIEQSETPVYIVNAGECSSMAFLIFLAGHRRYSFPHSTFLMHDGKAGAYDSTAKVISQAKNLERIEAEVKKYVLAHTKITEAKYDKNYHDEWLMFPEEAQENGIVDLIIGKDIPFNAIY